MVGRKRNARIYHESCVPRRGAPLPSSCPPAVRCVLKQGKSRRRPARDAGGERGHPLHARCSIRDGKCHGGAMRRPWAHVGHGGAQPDTCLCLRLSMPPPPPRRRQRQSVSRFAKAPNAGEWRRGAGHPFHETPEMNGAGAGKDRRGPVDYPYVWSGVACWPMERGSPPPGRGFREGVGGAGKEWR